MLHLPERDSETHVGEPMSALRRQIMVKRKFSLSENEEAKKLYAVLGIVTGLAMEARLARKLGRVEVGGGLPAGAEAAAERLVAGGAKVLLSFGLAGGLDPALAAGTVVMPATVVENGTRFTTDPTLTGQLGGGGGGVMLAAAAALATPEEKRAAFAASGALAVDLESGAVARVAARHGLPFAVLRAVCDPAGRALPPAALAALDAQGAIVAWRVLVSVLARPWQIPALLTLADDAARARRALDARVIKFLSNGGA
jgi:adenosylhomocysteine nucleosidase